MPAFTAEGQDAASAAANPALNFEAIGPHHFDTLQVPIVRGRAFTADDRAGALAVAIVSADVAARTWPGRSPIGRRLKFGGPDSGEAVVDDRRRRRPDALPRAGRGAADALRPGGAVPRYRRAAGDSHLDPAGVGGAGDPRPRGGRRFRRARAARRDVRRDRGRALVQPRFHATVSGAFADHGGAAGGDRPLRRARRGGASPRSRDRDPHRRRRHAVDDPSSGGRRGHDARRDRRRRRRRRCRRHRAARGRAAAGRLRRRSGRAGRRGGGVAG